MTASDEPAASAPDPDPSLGTVKAAAPLVARALGICEQAGLDPELDLLTVLLRDVLNYLTDDEGMDAVGG